MKILYLAHRIPYPPNKGDKIRSFNEIKYLSERHDIHLVCLADDSADLKYKEDLKRYCRTAEVVLVNQNLAKIKSIWSLFTGKPLSVFHFYSGRLQKTIDHGLSTHNFDIIFCYSSQMAEYVFRSQFLVSRFSIFATKRDQNLATGVQKLATSNQKLGFQHRASSNQQPETIIQRSEPGNQQPTSSVKQLATSIQHPATSNHQPASINQHPSTIDQPPATKFIMDFVDVDSEKWKQYANYVKWPLSWIYALESKRLSTYERKIAQAFDHCIFVTHAEERIFKAKNPHINNITVVTNGVDLDYFSPQFREDYCKQPSTSNQNPATGIQHPATINHQPATSNQRPVLVFTGAMDYYANIDGVIWFIKEIFHLIKDKVPEVEFYIVGSKPKREVIQLTNNNGVKVTGYVPDTREYFRQASVAVVPLRIAQGIQNKILEPMAMGVPVVATPIAFQGIRAEKNRDLIVEEDAKGFANAVIQLLKEQSLRKSLGSNARRAIENNHNWTINLSKLDSILESSVRLATIC